MQRSIGETTRGLNLTVCQQWDESGRRAWNRKIDRLILKSLILLAPTRSHFLIVLLGYERYDSKSNFHNTFNSPSLIDNTYFLKTKGTSSKRSRTGYDHGFLVNPTFALSTNLSNETIEITFKESFKIVICAVCSLCPVFWVLTMFIMTGVWSVDHMQ